VIVAAGTLRPEPEERRIVVQGNLC